MKKLFTIVLISFLAISTTFAQIEEGTVMLGATSDVGTAWTAVALTPNVGYFLSDNMVVGMGFSMNTSTEDQDGIDDPLSGNWMLGTTTTKTSGMTISPYFRYYMSEMFFGHLGVSIGSGSTTINLNYEDENIDDIEGKEAISSFGLTAGTGVSLMWGDHICFEPMFLITMGSGSTTISTNVDGIDDVTVDAPNTLNLGISLNVALMLGDY